VFDEPGVTRDRTYHICEYGFKYFQVVDTGGLVFDDSYTTKKVEGAVDAAINHHKELRLITEQCVRGSSLKFY
jgi:predicted GTPase